jgi:hypothetical protein
LKNVFIFFCCFNFINNCRINERFEVIQNLLDNDEVKDEIVCNLLALGKNSDKKNTSTPSISVNTNVLKILTKLNSQKSRSLTFHMRDVEREIVRLKVSYNNVMNSVKDEKDSNEEDEDDNEGDKGNSGGDLSILGSSESLKEKEFPFCNPSPAEINAFSVLSARGGGGLKLENFLMIVNYFSYINRYIASASSPLQQLLADNNIYASLLRRLLTVCVEEKIKIEEDCEDYEMEKSLGLFPDLSRILPYFENCFTSVDETTVSTSSSLTLLTSSLSFSRMNEKGKKGRRIFTGHILSSIV